jgi:tetratricopeptide (TPR) repeat protein
MRTAQVFVTVVASALLLGATSTLSAQEAATLLEQARAAYQARADVTQARRAVELFEQAAQAVPAGYEARWEAARAIYYLGTYPMEDAPDRDKMALFDRGIALAREAVGLRPDGVEGHFWLGVMLGVYGEAKGMFKSLALVPDIRREMEICLELDPSVEGWGPDRVLGRMLHRLPWFKGGDEKKSREYLERSLTGAPTNALTMLYLAETDKSLGRKAEAVKLVQQVVTMEPDPRWAPEHPSIVAQAQKLLKKLS